MMDGGIFALLDPHGGAAREEGQAFAADIESLSPLALLVALAGSAVFVAMSRLARMVTRGPRRFGRNSVRRPWHVNWLSQATARRLYGRTTLMLAVVLAAAASAAVVAKPGVVTEWRVAVAAPDPAATLVWLTAIAAVASVLHEVARAIAMRAQGFAGEITVRRARRGAVCETDTSRLSTASAAQRHRVLMAGPLVDVASASALIVVVFASSVRWITLTPRVDAVLRAALFLYLARLVIQCYFFARTAWSQRRARVRAHAVGVGAFVGERGGRLDLA
jgi:hypothetical protein